MKAYSLRRLPIFTTLLFHFLTTTAFGSTTLSTDITIGSDSVSGKLNEAHIVGVQNALNFSQEISNTLILNASGGFSVETGSSETVYGVGTYQARNTLFLNEANINWRPWSWLSLKVGALNQSIHRNPLFITSTPFVGISQNFEISRNQWKLELETLQAIPSNHTLSQRLGEVDEGSARFFSERVRLTAKGDLISANFSIAHFAYENLSSSVAHESRLLGNSVSGQGQLNNQFLYNYRGYSSDASLSYKGFGKNTISFHAKGVLNNQAPSEQNKSYSLATEFKRRFSQSNASISFESFRTESDSTVAYYASKFYGNANRQGVATTLNYQNTTDQYDLGLRAARAENITSNIFQDDEKIISVFMRKSYGIL